MAMLFTLFYFDPIVYIFVMFILFVWYKIDTPQSMLYRINFILFMLVQLCYHVPFIVSWLFSLQGNPYRKLYGDLNPLATPIYLLCYFFVHLIFILLLSLSSKTNAKVNERLHLQAIGFRFVIYWVMAFVMQMYLTENLSQWQGISLFKNMNTNVDAPTIIKDAVQHDSAASLQPFKATNIDAWPPNENYIMQIIENSVYHENEIAKDNLVNQQWYGLYKTHNGYAIEETKIKLQTVNDPIVDNDDERSGIQVLCDIATNEHVILMSGIPMMSKQDIQFIKQSNIKVRPGEKFNFMWQEKMYNLFATGTKKNIDDNENIIDYQLYMENNFGTKQLLAASHTFDEAMMSVMFIGDIDNDGFPDLIMDTTNHYNLRRLALYLSSQAQEGMLLKLMAIQSSTGC